MIMITNPFTSALGGDGGSYGPIWAHPGRPDGVIYGIGMGDGGDMVHIHLPHHLPTIVACRERVECQPSVNLPGERRSFNLDGYDGVIMMSHNHES